MALGIRTQAALIVVLVTLTGVGTHAAITNQEVVQRATESARREQADEAMRAANRMSRLLGEAAKSLAARAELLAEEDVHPDPNAAAISRNLDSLFLESFDQVTLCQEAKVLWARPEGVCQTRGPLGFDRDGRAFLAVPLAFGLNTTLQGRIDHGRILEILFESGRAGSRAVLQYDDREVAQSAPPGDQGIETAAPVPAWPGLAVVRSVSGADVRSLQTLLVWTSLGVGTGAAVAALAVGLLLARSVTGPVIHLATVCNRLRSGHAKERARPQGVREFRQLAVTLNSTVDQLQQEQEALRRLSTTLEEKVQVRTRQLVAQTERLEAEKQALDDFASVVAHDLRAPLRGMYSRISLAEEQNLPAEAKEHLEQARERLKRMDVLVTGVLEYSRKGRVPATLQEVPVTRILREISESGILPEGFRLRAMRPMPTVMADPVQVLQVFQNLVGNAVSHHDRAKGTTRITWRDTGEAWEFVVADDGPGVPESERPDIFGLFRRGSHAKGQGVGLGLALVRRIVEANGGKVRYEPNRPRGARFVFTWPKSAEPESAPLAVQGAQSPAPSPKATAPPHASSRPVHRHGGGPAGPPSRP